MLDPYFSGTKIEWLLRNVDGLAERRPRRPRRVRHDRLLAVFKLTGEHVTDPSNASRTLLYDICARARGTPSCCELFGVSRSARCPSCARAAASSGARAAGFHGFEVPVAGIAGDQQAALFGQRCLEPGLGKNTYGTGSFVLLTPARAAPQPPEGLLTTIAWQIGARPTYALEAAIFVTGAAVQWLRDGLGIIERGRRDRGAGGARWSPTTACTSCPRCTGLGSPHWDPYARGTIVGLTRGNGRAHLARAALEAMAYQTVDAMRAMEPRRREPLAELRPTAARPSTRWLMQFQADVLGRAGRRARDRGDDGARRGAAGRRRRGPVDARRRRAAGASGRATSRAWARTSARRCWTAGTARSSAPRLGVGQRE